MANKTISYLSRDYTDYKNALINFSKTYYPDVSNSFNDASVGAWLVDLNAVIADELSYHIDRAFQETNINSANNKASIYALARNNGFKIPGPKGSMAEVLFTCTLPLEASSGGKNPDWSYAPKLKVGTRVSSSNHSFELLHDVDFAKQFNEDGVSDRTIQVNRDSAGNIRNYTIAKRTVVIASETKIYKKYITSSDIKPFMEILIPDTDIMNIESVIMKEGSVFQSNPSDMEFNIPNETSSTYTEVTRFFEVDSLIEQERWDNSVDSSELPIVTEYGYVNNNTVYPCYSITQGEWKPLKHKFVTEYTDTGYLKVIFGSSVEGTNDIDLSNADTFAKNQITRMMESDSLGVLPKAEYTIFIKYRTGGGEASNLAEGAINEIAYKNVDLRGSDSSKKSAILSSLKVESITESVSGKDMPTVDELRNMIKYYKGSQDRCITVKDYINRIYMMPPKYGTPYRVSGIEANNKIMLYLLGINYKGQLDASLPDALISNIIEYLQKYRSVNDYVEIKSGKIINVSFTVNLLVNKEYNTSDIGVQVRDVIKNYMAVNAHQMGDDIFVGEIEKKIGNIDGVDNVVKVRVYNETGSEYSQSQTTQEIVSDSLCNNGSVYEQDRVEIDLEASNKMLIADGDSMFEVKYPEGNDIKIQFIER